ncbi:MAG: hypothetical protein Q9170_004904 [Blastenia crenularia]
MDKSSTIAPMQETNQVEQRGLGILKVLPLEIRQAIWRYLIPGNTDVSQNDGVTAGPRPCCTSNNTPLPPSTHRSDLSALLTSQVIHGEVIKELYLKQPLTICINDQEHWHRHDWYPRTEEFWVTTDGICTRSSLLYTNPSKFSCVKLNIRFSNEDDGNGAFTVLKRMVRHFAGWIRAWQARTSRPVPLLQIDVVLEICPSPPEPEPGIGNGEEVCLDDIAHALRPLGTVSGIWIRGVEVGFKLRYGQEWLVEVLRQVVTNVKGPETGFRWEAGTRVQQALAMSRTMTRTGLGDGRLNMPPPAAHVQEGMNVTVRNKAGMDEVASMLMGFGWTVDPSVVTKISFTQPSLAD